MSENYRKSIANMRKLPQFTTMNVIDGQAGIIICSSLIFYSLTIDNILNIVVLLILIGVIINLAIGEKGVIKKARDAVETSEQAGLNEQTDMDRLYKYVADHLGEANKDVTDEEKSEEKKDEILKYGDKINYSANSISDWKIYYHDGENYFIIPSYFIPYNKIPQDLGIENEGSTYGMYWGTDKIPYNSSEEVDKNIAEKYMLEWTKEYTGNSVNKKALASIMDTSKWSSFVDNNVAQSAIGISTIEMFCKSWNEKYPNEKIYYNFNESGYNIGNTSIEKDFSVDVLDINMSVKELSGYKNSTLYFPQKPKMGDGNIGCYLASPCGDDRFLILDCDGSIWAWFMDNNAACDANVGYIRPVVCLKKGVSLYKNEGDECWNIEYKE